MLIKRLSLSKIGDLLKDRLGEQAEDYTFPEDFEKAVVDIDFRAIVKDGNSSAYDVIIIGDAVFDNGSFFINGANVVPQSVTFIGEPKTISTRSFYYLTSLTSIEIPSSVTIIGDNAFYNCTNLSKVKFNCTSLTIQDNAFNFCPGLLSMGVGSQYNVELPQGMTTIPNFRGMNRLRQAVIPDGATSILSFYQCTDLETLVIPDSVATLGSLYGCSSLLSVVGNNVTSFGSLQKLSACTNIYLPKVTSLANNSVEQCSSLQTAQFGSVGYPVTGLSNSAFTGCTQANLTITVYCADSYIDNALANIRGKATNATIVIKAANDMVYNNVSYQAGDTVVTSTPS